MREIDTEQYCNGFRSWMSVSPEVRETDKKPVEEALQHLSQFFAGPQKIDDLCSELRNYLSINHPRTLGSITHVVYKSNLLYRLIYRGQKLRTIQCPKHKGTWSGCVFQDKDACACVDAGNVTGWLPEPGDEEKYGNETDED